MNWLNYHHLLYFWMTAREGSVAKACQLLHLTQPTVSGQIRDLEKSLKTRLFDRSGRALKLTEAGQMVYRYANEIFTLGRELQDSVSGHSLGRSLHVAAGVADTLPKLLVHRLLAPALDFSHEVRLTCLDGDPHRLLEQLANHELDLILSDCPAGPHLGMKVFNHLLGDYGVSFFATFDVARRYRQGFPKSLDAAPMFLPGVNTALRRSLEQWFDEVGIRPLVRAEFTDSALLKAFGRVGDGVFVAPTVVEDEVRRMYRVGLVGREDAVRERVYAISVEKRLKNPAALAIWAAARKTLARE